MSTKVAVYDRDGRVYYLNAEEAALAVKSGAYRTEAKIAETPPPKAPLLKSSTDKIGIVEKKTGAVFQMLPIDAREAVKTGHFEYAKVEVKKDEKKSGNGVQMPEMGMFDLPPKQQAEAERLEAEKDKADAEAAAQAEKEAAEKVEEERLAEEAARKAEEEAGLPQRHSSKKK